MNFRVLISQPIAREGVEELFRAGLEVVEPPSWDVQGCADSKELHKRLPGYTRPQDGRRRCPGDHLCRKGRRAPVVDPLGVHTKQRLIEEAHH